MLILGLKFKYLETTEFCAKFCSNPTFVSLSMLGQWGKQDPTVFNIVILSSHLIELVLSFSCFKTENKP